MSKRCLHGIGDLVICTDENIIITDSGCDQSIINLNSFLVQSFTGIYYNVGGALQGMHSNDLEIVSDAFTLCTLPDDTKVLNSISVSLTLIHYKQKRFFNHIKCRLMMVFWSMIALNDIHPLQGNLVNNVLESDLIHWTCILMDGKPTSVFRSQPLLTSLST